MTRLINLFMILFPFVLVGFGAGWWLPKPPDKSGAISFGFAFLAPAGVILTGQFLFERYLVWIGPGVIFIGMPLAIVYSSLSLGTTRHRWLAITGLVLTLIELAVVLNFILNPPPLQLG